MNDTEVICDFCEQTFYVEKKEGKFFHCFNCRLTIKRALLGLPKRIYVPCSKCGKGLERQLNISWAVCFDCIHDRRIKTHKKKRCKNCQRNLYPESFMYFKGGYTGNVCKGCISEKRRAAYAAKKISTGNS